LIFKNLILILLMVYSLIILWNCFFFQFGPSIQNYPYFNLFFFSNLILILLIVIFFFESFFVIDFFFNCFFWHLIYCNSSFLVFFRVWCFQSNSLGRRFTYCFLLIFIFDLITWCWFFFKKKASWFSLFSIL